VSLTDVIHLISSGSRRQPGADQTMHVTVDAERLDTVSFDDQFKGGCLG
jgi:hypothetical protein